MGWKIQVAHTFFLAKMKNGKTEFPSLLNGCIQCTEFQRWARKAKKQRASVTPPLRGRSGCCRSVVWMRGRIWCSVCFKTPPCLPLPWCVRCRSVYFPDIWGETGSWVSLFLEKHTHCLVRDSFALSFLSSKSGNSSRTQRANLFFGLETFIQTSNLNEGWKGSEPGTPPLTWAV